jgi:spore maturation protein CgeB
MRIVFAALKYDYGLPERGLSFEYYNFYDTLVRMGHEVEYFDFYSLYREVGSVEMTKRLRERIEEVKPDLLFVFLYSDEFDPVLLQRITNETNVVTFNWFADDHWRFESFSRKWAACFRYVSTTDRTSVPKYHALGYKNVLLTQWGANTALYRKTNEPIVYDVSFVGQAHGDRPAVIRALQNQGISVYVRGTHWNVKRWHNYGRRLGVLSKKWYERLVNESRIPQEEMVKVFHRSRVNLNLSASSQLEQNQIKGRNFEIPACGGFQLSGIAERLEEFFEPHKEIVLYRSFDELVEKIRYYLAHESERAEIAEAGYQRVLREHTYEHRFRELFRQMGLT